MSTEEQEEILARWERPDSNGRGETPAHVPEGPTRAVVLVCYMTAPENVSDEKLLTKLYALMGLKRGTWPNWLSHVEVEEVYDPDETE